MFIFLQFGLTRNYWIPIPIFIFWPLFFIVYLCALLIHALIPTWRRKTQQIRLGIRALFALHGFHLAVQDADFRFRIYVW